MTSEPASSGIARALDPVPRLARLRLPAFLGPLAMALGFVVVVALAASTLWLIDRSRDTRAWVDHTREVQTAIASLRADLIAGESARRGYLLDPDPMLDAAYRQAAAILPQRIDALQTLVDDSPGQSTTLQRFRTLYQEHDVAQTASILGVRIGARAPAVRSFRADGSNDRIRAMDSLLISMSERENQLLAERTQEEVTTSRLLFSTTVAGVALIALLGLLSIAAYARDAAALQRSRDQLRRFNEELETAVATRTSELQQANAEIQRFAHLVSHDLRAPLVNIVGFTNELRRVREALELPEQQRPATMNEDFSEAIQFIQLSAEKMDRLVNSILRMAREGRRTLTPQPVAMGELIGVLLDNARSQAVERQIDMQIENNLPDLVSDRLAVEQVFSNLIDNAVKYSKKGEPGRLRIRGRAVGGWTEYEVEDDGIGIAPKDQVRIFDMFRRAGNSDEPGEGVGLAYIRQIVRRLGGVIQVHSRLGEGAKFRVSLPRKLTVSEESGE